MCVHWMPKILVNNNKVAVVQVSAVYYKSQDDNFLDCIISGDKHGYLIKHLKVWAINAIASHTFTICKKIQIIHINMENHGNHLQDRKSHFFSTFCLKEKTKGKECWYGESALTVMGVCTITAIYTLLMSHRSYCGPSNKKFWSRPHTKQLLLVYKFEGTSGWKDLWWQW